jgi:hypothetical protein
MGESDVFQVPEKLRGDVQPGLLVFEGQLLDALNLLLTPIADVLSVSLQNVKQNQLP